ncbi:MAG: stage III sporulation protein AB [Roseburia sp.]|nr:stage III sporulation protein AB [Roseburia sp.]MCM1278449.1 stage III sporulation protein AB [Robinsoniella sp.]
MRYIGFLLLLTGCTGLGMCFVEDYKERIQVLSKIQKMLCLISDRILSEKDSLPEAFFHTGSRFEGKWRQFLREMYEETEKRNGKTLEEIWKEKSSILQGVIKERDFPAFREAMKQTCFHTQAGQLSALKDYQMKMEEDLKELTEQKKEKCKLYQSLGIMSGILLIIILW